MLRPIGKMEPNSRKNESFVPSLTDLDGFLTEHDSNVVWLLVATILSCGWIIYLTYYNSRNLGLILTLVLNRLYKNGYVHIGSFSFSVLSGKVMFREIYYINEDVSIRIQDGFLIFRWWKMYNPKQKQHDPKAETRLYITVNGFEFHVYNRYDLYAHLQELFGLEPTIIPKRENTKLKKNREKAKSKLESITTEAQDPSSSWRSLIPVIKVDINTGRLAFGNRFLPQTLCINFDDAFLTYTTKLPSSHLDQFMHIVKGKLENVRVMLVPSPRHVSLQNDEPPRLMGEGFVVMQSNDVDIYYYMDEPGIVLEETGENAEQSPDNENTKLQDLPPCWGLDIVCGKGTDFNYGPWADRQRLSSLSQRFLHSSHGPKGGFEERESRRHLSHAEVFVVLKCSDPVQLLFSAAGIAQVPSLLPHKGIRLHHHGHSPYATLARHSSSIGGAALCAQQISHDMPFL